MGGSSNSADAPTAVRKGADDGGRGGRGGRIDQPQAHATSARQKQELSAA